MNITIVGAGIVLAGNAIKVFQELEIADEIDLRFHEVSIHGRE